MMKKFIVMVIVMFSITVQARTLTDVERKAVEATVKENLKDPDSAKFYHGNFPYPEKTAVYCGYVNAKNSYGGYSGKQLFSNFVAVNKNGVVVAPSLDYSLSSGEPLGQEIISSNCAGAGYDIPVSRRFFKDVNKKRKKNGIPELSRYYIKN
jgi:hypothetical protein